MQYSHQKQISASISPVLIYAVFVVQSNVFGASFASSLLNPTVRKMASGLKQGFGVARCVSAALQVGW